MNPEIEVQSREEITVGWNVHHLALMADSLISLIHLEMQRKVFILLLPALPPSSSQPSTEYSIEHSAGVKKLLWS